MPTNLDDLNKTIAEMKDVLASNKNADGSRDKVLDTDALVATFTKALDQWNATNSADAVRKGEQVGPISGGANGPAIVEQGKFAGARVDDLMFADWMLSKAQAMKAPGATGASKELRDITGKALTATGAGTGDEYVPTGMAASLWNDFFIASRVASQFDVVQMPTDPWDWPLGWGDGTWRKGTQNTATTVSDPATAKSTMTATEQVLEYNFSYSLDEDSIVAVMPSLRAQIARDGAEQIDRFVMNADATNAGTGNINLDDADPDDDSYYLTSGQDGLRHQIIVDNTNQAVDLSAVLTDALTRTAIGKLGKYATDLNRLVLFCNPKTYVLSMLGLTNVATYDKFGPGATILTGQLANYSGIPVIPTSSIALAEDDGKVSTTANNNDEGTILIAHRDMWKVGFRRNLLLEMFRDVQKRSVILVASFRIAVAARGTRSTNTHTAGAFGITYS
jgi:HK97 family phage major capsid protein